MKKYYLKKAYRIERLVAFELPSKEEGLTDSQTLYFTRRNAEACKSMGKILSSMKISHTIEEKVGSFFVKVNAKEGFFFAREEDHTAIVCQAVPTLEYV